MHTMPNTKVFLVTVRDDDTDEKFTGQFHGSDAVSAKLAAKEFYTQELDSHPDAITVISVDEMPELPSEIKDATPQSKFPIPFQYKGIRGKINGFTEDGKSVLYQIWDAGVGKF